MASGGFPDKDGRVEPERFQLLFVVLAGPLWTGGDVGAGEAWVGIAVLEFQVKADSGMEV